jgi:molecular chaperone HscB
MFHKTANVRQLWGTRRPTAALFHSSRRIWDNQKVVKSYFDLLPRTFPDGAPPNGSFFVDAKSLRREFRTLQSENHPDIILGSSVLNENKNGSDGDGAERTDDKFSALLNRAYSTLKNPYSRIAHIVELNHPEHPDITRDEVAKDLIAQFQTALPESSLEYKEMLMNVLEAHEQLEMATLETDLDTLSQENDERIRASEETIDSLLKQHPLNWDLVMMEAIKLKYWVNIHQAIRDWEPGKPVHLTH